MKKVNNQENIKDIKADKCSCGCHGEKHHVDNNSNESNFALDDNCESKKSGSVNCNCETAENNNSDCQTEDKHCDCQTEDNHCDCQTEDKHCDCQTEDKHCDCQTEDKHCDCQTEDKHCDCQTEDNHCDCQTEDKHCDCQTEDKHCDCQTEDNHCDCKTVHKDSCDCDSLLKNVDLFDEKGERCGCSTNHERILSIKNPIESSCSLNVKASKNSNVITDFNKGISNDNCICKVADKKESSHDKCKSADKKVKNDNDICGCGVDNKSTNHNNDNCGCGIEHEKHDGCCGEVKAYNNKFRPWINIGIAFIALVISFLNPFKNLPKSVQIFDFAWITLALCAIPIYRGAIKNIIKGKITSALLISIAMTASIVMFIIGLFLEGGIGHEGHSENYLFVAGEVAWLMAIGQKIELLTKRRSNSAITNLIKSAPEFATLVTETGSYIDVKVSQIIKGNKIVIKSNDVIPVDGFVISGQTAIETAMITGESEPVDVKPGDKVFSGSRNTSGSVIIEALTSSGDSTLSKLINYVKEAEKNRAPIANIADRWAGRIVPAAVIISILVFLFTKFVLRLDAMESILRGITILVVFCPCALALATPTAISAGIGRGSKEGILIKGGDYLERLASINTVAFDKTGTLTKGEIKVENVFSKQIAKEKFMQLVASAESVSDHPIAKAIVQSYKHEDLIEVVKLENKVGVGIEAELKNGDFIRIFKLSLLNKNILENEKWISNFNQSKTVVIVEINGKIEGGISLTDTIREGAKETVEFLHRHKIKTVMLTGDNKYSAKTISKQLGIDEHYAEMLPEDKVRVIEELQNNGNSVLMVGDGVNDAPALAIANVSMAMGVISNSVAMETADISLMESKIEKIPYAIKLGKSTLNTIKFNIALSMSINFIAIILSASGLLNAVMGAFVHNISSVLVCLNSARLLGFKGERKKRLKFHK